MKQDTEERWKPIPGMRIGYFVSNLGRIKRTFSLRKGNRIVGVAKHLKTGSNGCYRFFLRGVEAPTPPVRFTIDDEPFEFNPLPLGSLMAIEEIKTKFIVNQKLLQVAPVAEWIMVCKRHTDEVRKIVALLTISEFSLEVVKERLDFLRRHCSVEDLCSLFIIGTAVQNLWLRDAGVDTPPVDLEGIGEQNLWKKPFVELIKK